MKTLEKIFDSHLDTYATNPNDELWEHIWKKPLGDLNNLMFDTKLHNIYKGIKKISKVTCI